MNLLNAFLCGIYLVSIAFLSWVIYPWIIKVLKTLLTVNRLVVSYFWIFYPNIVRLCGEVRRGIFFLSKYYERLKNFIFILLHVEVFILLKRKKAYGRVCTVYVMGPQIMSDDLGEDYNHPWYGPK